MIVSKQAFVISAITFVAIAAVAAPFRAPQQEQLMRDRSKTLTNLKQVSVAMVIYTADFDDCFPYVQSTAAAQFVTYPYAKSLDIWKTYNPGKSKFLMNLSIAGVDSTTIEKPSETILFHESKPWPDTTRCVSFTDTSSRVVKPEIWSKVSATLKLKLKKAGKPLPKSLGLDWAKKNGL